jgi:hypothetical protein
MTSKLTRRQMLKAIATGTVVASAELTLSVLIRET